MRSGHTQPGRASALVLSVGMALAWGRLAAAAPGGRPVPPGVSAALQGLPAPAQALDRSSGPPPPPPRPLERLTLEQALSLAAARNVTVRVADAEARRLAAVMEQIRAAALPTLVAGGTYTRLDDDRRLGDQVFVPADQLSGNLTLTVPLLAPQRWAAWAHAEQDRRASQKDAAATRRQIAVSTAHAYLAVLAAGRVLDSNERSRDVALAHYGFAYKRLAGGIGSELDAVRALQTLREDAGRVEASRAALVQAQGALGALLGLDQPADISESPDFRFGGTERPEAGRFLDLLPERRADLRALLAHEQAARRVVRDSFTDYLPSLSGVFMPLYQDPPSLVQPRFSWQIQLQLTVPIYDGGVRYGMRHQRSALLEQARAQLDGALSKARVDLSVGLAALGHSERSFEDARRAAELARRAVEIAELSYRLGATTNLELLDAQRRARDADTAAVMAEDELRRVRLDLLAAAGSFPTE